MVLVDLILGHSLEIFPLRKECLSMLKHLHQEVAFLENVWVLPDIVGLKLESIDEKQVCLWIHTLLMRGQIPICRAISIRFWMSTNEIFLLSLLRQFAYLDHIFYTVVAALKLIVKVSFETVSVLNISQLPCDIPLNCFLSQNYG